MAKAPIISPDNSAESTSDAPVGKGRPTPTRREREKANLRPLVPTGKEAQKAQRDRVAEQRNRARIGMSNGEEKYLPARDKGPQRRYTRDYIDARYSVGEIMIPVMIIVLILSAVPAASSISFVVIWAFVLVGLVDWFFLTRRIHAKLAEKFGTVEPGLRWYIATRTFQFRMIRTPRPQVKRGQFPE